MFSETMLLFQSLFVNGNSPEFKPPKVDLKSLKGKRPIFTHRVTLPEQRDRFEDPQMANEMMMRLLATAAETGDFTPIREWTEKMAKKEAGG